MGTGVVLEYKVTSTEDWNYLSKTNGASCVILCGFSHTICDCSSKEETEQEQPIRPDFFYIFYMIHFLLKPSQSGVMLEFIRIARSLNSRQMAQCITNADWFI
jgi:hypothetical protein